jgi:hypothetical protein
MITRIHFQDAVAELTLEEKKPDAEAKGTAASKATAPPAVAAKAKKGK